MYHCTNQKFFRFLFNAKPIPSPSIQACAGINLFLLQLLFTGKYFQELPVISKRLMVS